VDADGTADFAVGEQEAVNVFVGGADRTLQQRGPFAVHATQSLALADVNSDGYPDLVGVQRDHAFVSVLLGDGNGAFGPETTYPCSVKGDMVAAGDFDGDGRPDLAVIGDFGADLSVLYNTCLP
jgi:hypothetical protein